MPEPINVMSPEFRANPASFYAQLLSEPIQQVEPGGLWALSRYEDVQYVLRNPKLFTSAFIQQTAKPEWIEGVGNPLADSMVGMDPPSHTRMRGLVSHAFTPRTIARLEERIRARARELTEEVCRRQEVDFVQAFSMPLPAFIIGELLGLSSELRPRLKQWSDDTLSIAANVPVTPERIAYLRSSLSEFQGYLREVIADRRRQPREDMMSDLVAAEVEGKRLSDDEVLAFGTLLLVGGLETTVHLISHTVLRVARSPELLARMRAEPALLPALVEEVLRLDSPIRLLLRLTTQEVEVAGVTLPPYTPLALMLGSANRDERQFERPEELVLERRSQNIAFGYGAHFCLGAMLARMEARIGLEELFARCQGFVLAPEELKWSQTLIVHGPVALPLRAIPSEG